MTRSVPPGAIVEGNPASIVGYVDTLQGPAAALQITASQSRARVEPTPVAGVTVHHFPVIPDLRGNLTVGEFDRQIPFLPKRYFMVFGVPSREVRGEHAHLACHQFLICLRGSCAVVADDGMHKVEVALDSPDRGLYLPPLTWGIQYKYSSDAMLLVFASGLLRQRRLHPRIRGVHAACRCPPRRRADARVMRAASLAPASALVPRIRKAARVRGKSLTFRDADVADAEFILALRGDPAKSAHLSRVSPRLADQIAWLARYRGGHGEAYFVIDGPDAEPLGTVRLYDARGASFCWAAGS